MRPSSLSDVRFPSSLCVVWLFCIQYDNYFMPKYVENVNGQTIDEGEGPERGKQSEPERNRDLSQSLKSLKELRLIEILRTNSWQRYPSLLQKCCRATAASLVISVGGEALYFQINQDGQPDSLPWLKAKSLDILKELSIELSPDYVVKQHPVQQGGCCVSASTEFPPADLHFALIVYQAEAEPNWLSQQQSILRDMVDTVVTELELRFVQSDLAHQVVVFKNVCESLRDALIVSDSDGQIQFMNRAYRHLFHSRGHRTLDQHFDALEIRNEQDEVITLDQHPLPRAVLGHEVVTEDLSVIDSEGDLPRWFSVQANPVQTLDGVVFGGVASLRDITKARYREDRLRELNLVDDLTGLSNVKGFRAFGQQLMHQAARDDMAFHVTIIAVVDLDHLIVRWGDLVGESLLMGLSEIIKKTFRTNDLAARIGPNEMALVGVSQSIEEAHQRLMNAVAARNQRLPEVVPLEIVLGSCSVHPQVQEINQLHFEELLSRARLDMQSKSERD